MKTTKIITTTIISAALMAGSINCHTMASEEKDIASNNPNMIYGDFDMDQKVTLSDAIMALNLALGTKDAEYLQTMICDVDGNGKVDLEDAKIILSGALGIDNLKTASSLSYNQMNEQKRVLNDSILNSFEYNNHIFTKDLLANVIELRFSPSEGYHAVITDPQEIEDICRSFAAFKINNEPETDIWVGSARVELVTPDYIFTIYFSSKFINLDKQYLYEGEPVIFDIVHERYFND